MKSVAHQAVARRWLWLWASVLCSVIGTMGQTVADVSQGAVATGPMPCVALAVSATDDCEGESLRRHGNASLSRIPSLMDNLYRYNVNSESDLVTFRHGPEDELKQVLTFYNAERRLSITLRDFPDGQWSDPLDVHAAIGNDELEYDSHNSTAFGVAADGTFFITANQHVDPLRMAKTQRPWDIGSFKRLPPQAINGRDDDRVTYPSFTYLGDELYFSYREQEVGGGKPAFRWLIKRWDVKAGRWQDMAQLNTGIRLRLYVSNIAWNADRSELHLVACWRDDNQDPRTLGTRHQHDLFHLYSRDGLEWQQYIPAGEGEGVARSQQVSLPVHWESPGQSTVPALIWNTGKGDPTPSSAGSIAIDLSSRPHVLNDSLVGELYYHHHDGNRWQSVRDVFPSHSEDLFRLADGMGAIAAHGDEIRFHRLSPHLDRGGVLLARGFVTRAYNASVDRRAIDHGWLSILLTRNQQHPVGSVRGSWPVDAWIMSIPLEDLDDFDQPFIRH